MSTEGKFVEEVVSAALRDPERQLRKGPWNPLLSFFRPDTDDLRPAHSVEDGSYLSGRSGLDAALIARRISSLLSPGGKCVLRERECACNPVESCADGQPIINMPVEIAGERLSFLVFPGESIEARARSFCKKYGGKYVNHVDFDRDVQTLSASARELQKKS